MAKRSHSRRQRRSLRGGSSDANQTAVVVTPSVEIGGFVPNNVQVLTPVSGGGRQKRGGAILNDIAIPALFIAANNMVASRRSKGKSKSRSRRVKFSRKRR